MGSGVGGAISAALKDGIVTFLWVLCASSLGALTSIIASSFNADGDLAIGLLITTSLIFVLVFVFNLISDVLGGATFNPTATAAFYAVGLGDDSLLSMALRFPAQAVGAMGGALVITEYMPAQFKHTLKGPSLMVDPHVGAAAEGILTFVITLAVLWIVLRGPKSAFVKTWLISIATVALVLAGAGYTGPSMNPANAYGWAYLKNEHHTWEQFYVYWICPFIGAILAGWFFKVIFPPEKKTVKTKKA